MTISSTSRPAPARNRLRTALLFIGALVFLSEEWLWTGFLRLFRWLGRFGLLRWLDARLVRLAPLAALVILCIPIALLFPVKIVGLWMITTGRFFGGCCVMLAAKVLSTAIIARLFITCRPQLLRMPWFARLYAVTCALRERVHHWMGQQPAWADATRFVRRLRARVRGFFQHGDRARGGTLRRWRSRRRAAVVAALARAPVERYDGDSDRH
jgi:hypothetical protein